jgi:hypothetical protein
VRYLFLVSKSKAKNELSRYYGFFETEARIAKEDFNLTTNVDEMICIQQLPYEWDNYPFIFYRQQLPQNENDKSIASTVAIRGNFRQSGIADYYEAVPPEYAEAIARAILAQAPAPIRDAVNIHEDNFVPMSEMQNISPKRVN